MNILVVTDEDKIKALIEQSVEKAVMKAMSQLNKNSEALKPTHVTQIQAAEILQLNRSTVNKLVKSGQLKLNACGKISMKQLELALE